ncbi:MAG: glycosyltransferase family 4 protein [Planctomycetota bacterium]|nr:glycosyltransferase family 4 protein [Planctomycetota bacterium]
MHIAIVTVFPKEAHSIDGGVAGVAKYLVDELVKQPDIKLTVVVPKNDTGEITCEGWGDFNVYRLGKQGPWSFLPGTVYDIFAGKRQLRSLLRQINPDIVHFQGVTFLAANCEKPNILTIHGIAERDAIWDSRWGVLRRLKWLLLKLTEEHGRRRVPNIILISEYVRRFLPIKNEIRRSWLIENPVADFYFDIDRQFEPGRIFCCSRIRPLKNILGMIKAFALVAQQFPDSQLRIAGAPETHYLETCKRQIEVDGLQDKVHFLGNISIEDVQLELSKANCLVAPSFQENSPLTIAEAMAAGVPVVAARVGGIPEMVEDGRTGLLVDPNVIDSISGAVSKVLSDQKLACSMGRRAKEAADRFRASTVCEKTLQAYRDVLAESS